MKKIIKIAAIIISIAIAAWCIYQFSAPREPGSRRELVVYETPVESSDECSSYEDFDPETSTCYFECATDAECAEITDAIDAELSEWTDELSSDSNESFDETAPTDSDMLAVYDIGRNESISIQEGYTDDASYHDLWNSVAELSPDSLTRSFLESFAVYDNPNDDTLAYVADDDGNGVWTIAFNIGNTDVGDTREQKATIIHELAHVISLNTDQVRDQKDCPNLVLDEGCARTDSYINQFWNAFWKNNPKPTYNSASFITEYAQTDVTEDFAETFAFFVLEKDKSQLGTEIKYQKIAQLYNYPELVSIRDDMRHMLSRAIVRARKN